MSSSSSSVIPPITATSSFDASHPSPCEQQRRPTQTKPTAIIQSTHHGGKTGRPSSLENFDSMILLSSQCAHSGPIWCLTFSHDGRYLATAGQDKQILIWKVSGCRGGGGVPEQRPADDVDNGDDVHDEERQQQDADSRQDSNDGIEIVNSSNNIIHDGVVLNKKKPSLSKQQHQQHPFFLSPIPLRTFDDHDADIIDLSWSSSSSTNFLLSASLDKTTRLYHPSRSRPLQIFYHSDMVTSVQFHPFDDDRFVTGSFDRKVRVWSVRKERVMCWTNVPDVVSRVRFEPTRGNLVVVGLQTKGRVMFFSQGGVEEDSEREELRYVTQLACRNKRGVMKEGMKVTGLEFLKMEDDGGKAEIDREGLLMGEKEKTRIDDVEESGCDWETSTTTTSSSGALSTRSDTSGTRALSLSYNLVGSSSSSSIPKHNVKESETRIAGHRALKNNRRDLSSSLSSVPVNSIPNIEKLLVTTNDSRVRLYGLDDYCMIRKYKGLENTSMQIKAHFSQSGNYIICGSDVGKVYIWETRSQRRSLPIHIGGKLKYEKSHSWISFDTSTTTTTTSNDKENDDDDPPPVTNAHFAPTASVQRALPSLLSSINNNFSSPRKGRIMKPVIDHDLSSAIVVTGDFEGMIKVFVQKLCLEKIDHALGLGGNY